MMTRRHGRALAMIALAASASACRSAPNESPVHGPAATRASDPGSGIDASITTDAAAAATPPEDAPLPWGTRPPRTGPLFTVVDGTCARGEVWPLAGGGALYSYGDLAGGRTTLARFVDAGLEVGGALTETRDKDKAAFAELSPFAIRGSWPDALVVFSIDRPGTRARGYESVWSHTADGGWTSIASHRDAAEPQFDQPILFKGNAILTRHRYDGGASLALREATFHAVRIAKDAPTLTGVAALNRPGLIWATIFGGEDEIYALGTIEVDPSSAVSPRFQVLRVWRDGKVREVRLPAEKGERRVIASTPAVLMTIDATKVQRLDGDKLVPVPLPLPGGSRIVSVATAPNGDQWFLLAPPKILVLKHGSDAGADAPGGAPVIEEMSLPVPSSGAPTTPTTRTEFPRWPSSGTELVGVEHGDPYAIGEGGSVVHYEGGGKWTALEMPKPPFATTGTYRAEALAMPSKGDLYVNAISTEKGLGWKTPARYGAVLRTKRPRETLRCNEPPGNGRTSGRDFMSYPPLADDSCTTPFAVLLRTAYGITSKSPRVLHGPKVDFPWVREAIKATPSLATPDVSTIDLVEVASGDQRYLGAKVPSVAAGKELIATVIQRVRNFGELRPELVCGQPTPARVIHVEIATGKVVPE